MWRLLPVVLVALAGCSSKPEVIPVQPPAPTKPDNVQTLGKDLDKTDHRVGAALVAIERNADKPKVVVAESRLAQSYLPLPPESDVQFALARATKQDPLDYSKQMAFGRQLATAVNKAWERLEADQAEAKRVSDLKDKKIAELTQEVIRVKQEASNNVWTIAGAALAVIGGVVTALVGPRTGIPLLLCGGAIGAFPFVVESPYWNYIAGTTLGIACGLGLYLLWDYVRDKANEDTPKDQGDV
jgi:hypothetical protein